MGRTGGKEQLIKCRVKAPLVGDVGYLNQSWILAGSIPPPVGDIQYLMPIYLTSAIATTHFPDDWADISQSLVDVTDPSIDKMRISAHHSIPPSQ